MSKKNWYVTYATIPQIIYDKIQSQSTHKKTNQAFQVQMNQMRQINSQNMPNNINTVIAKHIENYLKVYSRDRRCQFYQGGLYHMGIEFVSVCLYHNCLQFIIIPSAMDQACDAEKRTDNVKRVWSTLGVI